MNSSRNAAASVLAIDCGNSRLKWGLHDGAAWTRIGTLGRDELAGLAEEMAGLPEPRHIAIANVAGVGLRTLLEPVLSQYRAKPAWLVARARQCGVSNGYAQPEKLGVDRWCALVGARHLAGGPCLVVGAGTATTVDMLAADGRFLGGVILPGFQLMKRSLAENTAGLPLAEGEYVAAPCNTADAIETGVLLAQAGAVERMHAQLRKLAGVVPVCLVSGGATPRIIAALSIGYQVVDHLVLEGVLRMARDPSGDKIAGTVT